MTGYLYDDDQVIAEYDARGKVRAQYIHGPGLGADVGSLVWREDSAGAQYYSHNWRGDVTNIADSAGVVLNSYRYDSFGNIIDNNGSFSNDILFSSKQYDSDTGLYYFGARYYDPSSGRFISADPLGFVDGPNEYILAMNNPLLWIDPWGLTARFGGDVRTAYHSSFNTSFGNPINPDFSKPSGEIQVAKAGVNVYADLSIETRNQIRGAIIGIATGSVKGGVTASISGFLVSGSGGAIVAGLSGIPIGAIAGGIDAFLTSNIPQANSSGSSTAYSGIVGLFTGTVNGGVTGFVKESVAGIGVGKIASTAAGGMINGPMNALLNIATAPIEYELNQKAAELENKIIEWGKK